MRKIAIVSSLKWVGKVLEEQWLQEALHKKGYKADILAWNDDKVLWRSYQAVILRSAWGYHRYLSQFHDWLNHLDQIGMLMFNSSEIIRWNMYKDLQFDFFKKNLLSMIPSVVIKGDCITNYSNDAKLSQHQSLKSIIKAAFRGNQFVIKPIVSGSGENTYLIGKTSDPLKNIITMEEGCDVLNRILLENPLHGVIIQQFMPEIEEGEHSFVYFDRQLSHVILRYPGILGKARKIHEVREYSQKTKELANQVMMSLNDRDILYARVDIVETLNGPYLMELELVEPHLLIRHLNEQRRNEAIDLLANCIDIRMNKIG